MGTVSSDGDAALRLLFEFLLRLATRSNNLSDVVQRRVVGLRNVDLALLFGWLVVRWGHIGGVHGNDLVNQT